MSEIHILAGIEVAAADRAAFMAIIPGLMEGSRKEAGCRRYEFMQELDNELAFSFVETWASATAIEEHEASPHFKKLVEFFQSHTVKVTIKKYHTLF